MPNKKRVVLYALLFLGVALIITLAIVLILHFTNQDTTPNQNSNPSPSTPQKPIVFRQATKEDYLAMQTLLEQSSMIQDLPKSGVLLLSLYNFDSGTREWEKDYTITKGEVSEGKPSEYDPQLILHSKYLTIFDDYSLCQTIQIAQKNNDFASATEKSTLSLSWKYKSMLEYKECLGM